MGLKRVGERGGKGNGSYFAIIGISTMNVKPLVKLIVPQSMVPTVKRIYDNVNALSTLIKKNLHQRYLSVRLDTNNRCNLRCKYCYTLSHEREPFKIMTIDEFKKIADELFPQSYNVYLSCAWEPLVNKHFVEYIDIAARYSLPSLNFITNGVLFNDEIIRASIKAPVHQIDVSIDADNKNSYEAICGRDFFDRVIANLRRISELKKEHHSVYPRVGIVFVNRDVETSQKQDLKSCHREVKTD